jgi:tRNA(Arg) A34 adenosine deaminase TadA
MQRAVEAASDSDHHKWMLGAVITQGSNVLAVASNKVRNPPWVNYLHATTHAEMAALARCVLPVKGCNHLRSPG